MDLAQMMTCSFKDGPERWDAVKRALLIFVRDATPTQASNLVDAEAGLVDGRRVTEAEVTLAFEFLQDHGLVTATAS